jgi:hypothetical protein
MAEEQKGTESDDSLYGGDGADYLSGGTGNDRLEGGDGDDTFVQDFSQSGNNTIFDFNPDEDTIDFQGIDSSSELSITETEDGGTFIDAGNGSTLTITGVTPDQLTTDNVTIGGESLSGEDLNLQSTLVDLAAATASTDGGLDALSGALDGATQQGGAPAAGGAAGAGGGAVGIDLAVDEVETEEADEAQVEKVAVGP